MQLDVSTRLDAINYVIGSIGLAPVEAEDAYNLDVAQASQLIDAVSRDVQNNRGGGFWFNKEKNWKLSPDPVTGTISVPNVALSIYRFNEYNQQQKIATRGRQLYDTEEHGFDMRPLVNSDGYVRLMIITQLDFEDLPQTAKWAITTMAAVKFASRVEMDMNRVQVLGQEAQDAMWSLEGEETSQANVNAFKVNGTLAQFNANAGGFNNW
ncbi:tail tubular protein A [Aeromonas phage Aer_P220]|uniref:Tail tubular protein A n=1 Tax=Aeromonas phage Aer_P220 TaxID=2951227 RepID=A0A9E7NNH6_9CAUD|nr:tail tubular protein A [Aeromonas phage Aer_P220]